MKTYLRLLSYARPIGVYGPLYVIFIILNVVFSIVNIAMLLPVLRILFGKAQEGEALPVSLPEFELTLSYVVDSFNYHFGQIVISEGSYGALKFVCIALIISVFLSNVFRYLSGVTLARIRANVVTNLRTSIFSNVSNMHMGFFTNSRKGDIMSRITSDVLEVESSVVSTFKVIVKDPALIIGYFVMLFMISTELTLYIMLLLPVSGGIIASIAKNLKKKARRSQETLGRITGLLDEVLGGMKVVKAFTARHFVNEKFNKEVRNYARLNISIAKRFELAGPISEFLGVGVIAGILLIGGSLVLTNNSELEAEGFLTFIAVFSQVLQPAKSLTNSFSNIQRGLASGERIFQMIDTKPEIVDKPNAVEVKGLEKAIEFKNVGFAYENTKVLDSINFTLEKGKTIALVGPSGGGKSTLSDLLPRFYDPTEGSILLDGKDLRDFKLESLSRLIGIVAQDPILFNDSVFNNIAFGMKDVSLEKVMAAAKIAHAHEFIEQLEDGYETTIGDRGLKLSGGQRQRLSIARAVLKNPEILILDEATSALDSESERLVQDALTQLMKGRTSLVIAHRLSTIQHADEIIVLQAGQIVERGDHQALVASGGLYKKLIEMQQL
ncbi:ABC transporter ATP-binding protein [Cytophagales bacterium LB-30]|uniref:ABC transporter ATP-binding protein n=1 Tax=Shiella aurantiaca TaxID=3058365 RepID=A0ABT8F2I2_9BACT|nr:ABC transporter ATP-binding protein [Shiella aurantiaca]MDN4164650.1 ABC transporter ATP-binding protein [Shiella aurantiaca]